MSRWERIRKWAASLIWPEYAKEVEQLTARLATVHGRMQDLYWDGKAKEIAYSRIAGLEDALWRACVALAITGEEEAAKKFCEETGILWNAERVDRWRVKPPADALSEGRELALPGAPVVKICDCGYPGGVHAEKCYSKGGIPPPPAECERPALPEPGKGMPI